MATPNRPAPQATFQAAIAQYLPFEKALKDAWKLVVRFREAEGFREYLRRRAAFVVPAVALFVERSQSLLQAIPRLVLRFLVVPALEISQALLVGVPRLPLAHVYVGEPLLALDRPQAGHARPPSETRRVSDARHGTRHTAPGKPG
jgi:hypothetical protein